MINIYDKNCEEFNNNGIGILQNAITCEVSESLNGELILDMEYPINSKYSEYIINENIIKCDAGLEEEQLFRIKNVKPNIETIMIYAEHISYDLADNFLEDIYPQKLNGAAFLDWILANTQYKHRFSGFSDIQSIGTARYVRKNPIEVIIGDLDNSFVKLFGGELERNNYLIKMLTRRGNDKGYKIKYRKNLTGLDFTIDNSNIITKIMPKGYNGLLLPEKYIDSPLIENYHHPKIQLIEFSDVKVKENEDDEEGYDTEEEAYQELRRLCDLKYSEENIDKPVINVKIDFVDLSKTTEYKNYTFLEKIALGDTVTVELDYTQVETRVIKTRYDVLLHKFTKLELGEFKENYITNTEKNIQNTIKNETENITINLLEQAKKDATNLITKATTGYVILRPSDSPTEILIMDTPDINTAMKIWRWNMNGFAYSSNGVEGPYKTAITMDGQIVADFIKTGIINADLITAGTMSLSRLFGDVLTIGGVNNKNGSIEVYDDQNKLILQINKDGIYFKFEDEMSGFDSKIIEIEENINNVSASISIETSQVKTEVESNVTSTIMTLLNNGYLTTEQVNALVDGNTEEIATIKKQLTQTVTDTQMQIAIQTAIDGGVSYLKNTLFTIDENGMAIATSEDEFNALYKNKGMYLYSYDELIAKFDIDGSTLRNLKIEGEIETNNLREMDTMVDGVPHVHIHWIGG